MSPSRLSASQIPDSFDSIFNPLLNFKNTSRLTSLLSYQEEGYLRYFTDLFSPPAKFELKDLKEIKHRFQEWTTYLNRRLIVSFNDYFQMNELKRKCVTLENKIELVREKFRSDEEFATSPSLALIISLNNLEEIIRSINLIHGPDSLSFQFLKSPFTGKPRLSHSKEYVKQTDERFSNLIGEKDKELLINEFLSIDSSEYFIALGKVIKTEQAIKIVEETFERNFQKLIDKLPLFIFSLNFETLQHVICSHRIDLEALNQMLLKAQIFKSDKKMIQFFITYQCQQFCKFSNVYANLIDELNEKFRLIDIDDISFTDLKDLYNLKEKIVREFEIFKRFRVLIKSLPINIEVRYLIFGDQERISEVENNFTSNIHRMSDDIKFIDSSTIIGCPFKILDRKFEDSLANPDNDADISVERDDQIEDLLPLWKIFTKDNWIDLGLFDNFSEEALSTFSLSSDFYKIAKSCLKDLSIATVNDLFRLHLYNISMLKEYIQKNLPPSLY